mmetsp:Transcript_1410/g.8680  ORF Transcript_1410/g.8680 Transcript_1410/m.8680 type:complete len:304 (-) Transcript_1410:3191-4102(-)
MVVNSTSTTSNSCTSRFSCDSSKLARGRVGTAASTSNARAGAARTTFVPWLATRVQEPVLRRNTTQYPRSTNAEALHAPRVPRLKLSTKRTHRRSSGTAVPPLVTTTTRLLMLVAREASFATFSFVARASADADGGASTKNSLGVGGRFHPSGTWNSPWTSLAASSSPSPLACPSNSSSNARSASSNANTALSNIACTSLSSPSSSQPRSLPLKTDEPSLFDMAVARVERNQHPTPCGHVSRGSIQATPSHDACVSKRSKRVPMGRPTTRDGEGTMETNANDDGHARIHVHPRTKREARLVLA